MKDCSIFLAIHLNKQSYSDKYIEDFICKTKNIFSRKWLQFYLYNATISHENIIDEIYCISNNFGINLGMVIDKNEKILDIIENKYPNIENIIFKNVDLSTKYVEKLKKIDICNVNYESEIIGKEEVTSKLILDEKIMYID